MSLPDVIPASRTAGEWWPPVMLDPVWITANAGLFDLMHVHFGFESFSVGHLTSCVEALASVGRPLVFTVHDLQNPQLFDQTRHEQHLDVLIAGATVVTTLTTGAAREISQRWGREAVVIRHPHLLDFNSVSAESVPDPGERSTAVVGMHLGDIRAGTDARRATMNLVGAVRMLRAGGLDVQAEVHVSTRVRDEAARDAVAQACREAEGVTMFEHPRLSDDELVRALAALDANVLPYRHGTHSGWLELCYDLGVPVVAPSIGHWLDQHDEPGAVVGFDPGSVGSLAAALSQTLRHPQTMSRRAVRAERRAQRWAHRGVIATAHAEVYRTALTAVGSADVTSSGVRRRDRDMPDHQKLRPPVTGNTAPET
ncbi:MULTISPECIES: hypothetical protein [Cryobacterium]|uniref:D-inositol 3-phosphate glycosyltransferase n=1 Tax=Cryobacterium breve TaxID=1259258 RepID=A0ABY2J476_9MICO|nr:MULTISPECIES: hypothetical protein [Cryobacterium]TFC94114.1 hypothetical protein E3T20_09100 [Cryobacterium sp. TmT3-12]TFC98655.1 hypothetical protein E3O65_07190 [Cryobacterium breve]